MNKIKFTIKSVEPDDKDCEDIVLPDDLRKVIQDCHLDAGIFVAEADKEHLRILELAKRFNVNTHDNTPEVSDKAEKLEDANKDHIKILNRLAKESNIDDISLALKMVKPLVRVELPEVSLSIETDWKLNRFEEKLLERIGLGYGDLLNY